MEKFQGQCDGVFTSSTSQPEKLIIDTDPGIGERVFFFLVTNCDFFKNNFGCLNLIN